jgi:hypothetical protein
MGEDEHPIEELEDKDQYCNLEQRVMKESRDTLPEANGIRYLFDGEFPAQLNNSVHENGHGQSEPDNSTLAQQITLRDNWTDHGELVSV